MTTSCRGLDDEELAGETEEIVETEEEELVIVGEEPEEEAPAPKPAPKASSEETGQESGAKKKPAPKKKTKKSKPKKKAAKKKTRKVAKKKKRRLNLFQRAEKGRSRNDCSGFSFAESEAPRVVFRKARQFGTILSPMDCAGRRQRECTRMIWISSLRGYTRST